VQRRKRGRLRWLALPRRASTAEPQPREAAQGATDCAVAVSLRARARTHAAARSARVRSHCFTLLRSRAVAKAAFPVAFAVQHAQCMDSSDARALARDSAAGAPRGAERPTRHGAVPRAAASRAESRKTRAALRATL
jgi:hypothetical protein